MHDLTYLSFLKCRLNRRKPNASTIPTNARAVMTRKAAGLMVIMRRRRTLSAMGTSVSDQDKGTHAAQEKLSSWIIRLYTATGTALPSENMRKVSHSEFRLPNTQIG